MNRNNEEALGEDGRPLRVDYYRNLAKARSEKEAHTAAIKEIELAERRKELISIAEINKAVDQAVSSCREHLMGIGGRLAPIIAAEMDVDKIDTMLSSEIRRALDMITSIKSDVTTS